MSVFDMFRRRAREREMQDEMRFHLDMEAAELERTGLPPAEARRRALAAFGGVQRHMEEGHEARGGVWLEDLMRDIRFSARSLRHARGYSLTVILTLALGIAANTSIFSVANGVLFRQLPYRDPSRLMVLWDGLDWIGVPEAWVTGPELDRLRRETTAFEGFAAVRSGSVAINGDDGGEPQQVPISSVSANFFQVLGAGPSIGRGFAPGEDAPGAAPVTVISRRLWTQRFGADPSVIGRTIDVDGTPMRIIGVLPPGFAYSPQSSLGAASGERDLYVLLPDTLGRLPRNNHSIGVLARVKPDVSLSAALSQLAALSRVLDEQQYGKSGFRFVPVMLQERMVREVRPALLALLASVGVLMLIMCANLAVLALVRAARREREMSVRRAIGASHGRVARQIFTETVLLSLAGAVVGIGLGAWALQALLSLAPPGLPRRSEIGLDFTVLAVTLALAIVVGVSIGLAPVLHSVRGDISTVLRERAASRTGSGVRRGLVLLQLALSMVLLAGAGLLLGSFVRLMHVDPGFSPEHVLAIDVRAGSARYASGAPVVNVMRQYAQALRGIPGVVAVGATSAPPLSAGADQSGARFPGSPTNTGVPEHDRLLVDRVIAAPGFFRAAGIALVDGQEFDATANDSTGSRVAVIDDVLARRFFPSGGAVGQIIMVDGDSLRIVGVAEHVRMYDLETEGREQVWLPHARIAYRYMAFMLRTAGDPLALAGRARAAIRGVDPTQPIISVSTMDTAVRDTLALRRVVLTLVAGFAGAALLLAALGVYGVTSNAVTQRTRELGIRMALGADRRAVIWSVLGDPARLTALGLAIGLAGTALAGRLVQRLLYGVSPTDPLTLAGVALLLLAVSVLAGYVPARRATKVDPMVALRSD